MPNKTDIKKVTDRIIDNNDEFYTVDDLANNQNLINCYQMQVDENNQCKPVHLGLYPDVPLPVNQIIKYKNHNLHVVTYVLTEEEIKNKLFKIVGVNVFTYNGKNSLCSLDLVMNEEKGNFQVLFNDHINNTTKVVENLEKFPEKDNVLAYIINKAFEDPIKAILVE